MNRNQCRLVILNSFAIATLKKLKAMASYLAKQRNDQRNATNQSNDYMAATAPHK